VFGAGLPSLEIAGVNIGVREAVLVLIALVALYIAVVLWRMRRLGNGQEKPVPAPFAPVISVPPPVVAPAVADVVDEPAPADDERAAPRREMDDRQDSELAQELALLRDEVDVMRGELAALREDMLQEMAHLRAAQTVSPIYGDAVQMAAAGYDAAAIAERCGIARAEAELVVALARSQLE